MFKRSSRQKRLYRFRRRLSPITFHGIKVPTTADHISLTVWRLLLMGRYENPERHALLALLQEGDQVLKLGVGMGVVSGVAAKAMPSVRFTSYEANPAMIPVIQELHQINGITNIELRNAVLMPTDTPTTQQFHIAASFAESALTPPDQATGQTVEVPEEDIRAVLSDLRPDMILCDIEGAETMVFEGVDLSGLRAIVLELHPERIGRQAEARIYDLMAAQDLYPRIELCSGTVVAFERVTR